MSDDGSVAGRGFTEFEPPNVATLVCEVLMQDAHLDATHIRVDLEAASGDLTLSGTVSTPEELRVAGDCAASVEGVHVVHNRLTVARKRSSRPGDEG